MNYTRATRAARELLESLEIREQPVDVRKIAKKLNIAVLEAPHSDEDLSGLILKDKNKVLIGVNKSHSENRKRFTIAHELGHYILHKNRDVFVDRKQNLFIRYRRKTSGFSLEESEANAFAAELLMPEKQVKQDFVSLHKTLKEQLGKTGANYYDFIVNALAEKFMVSNEAMKIRIEILRKG